MDPFIHYGIAAGVQALRGRGARSARRRTRERIGVVIGSGIGGLPHDRGRAQRVR